MPIYKIYVMEEEKSKSNVRTETVYLLEGDVNPSRFVYIFVNTKHQIWSFASGLREKDGPIFEVRYKKAVLDPEFNSLFVAARAIGEHNLEWGRIGKRYQFVGTSYWEAKKIVEENFFNPIVQEIIYPEHGRRVKSNEKPLTLKPTGTPDPLGFISLKGMTNEELVLLSKENSWNAPLAQLQVVQKYEQARSKKYTDAELELIFGSWSDHCYHTTWKGLGLLQCLKDATAKINHPRVISAFHDNAGGIDFDGTLSVPNSRAERDGETVIILKGETHNHPFAIEPKGGIETKHGGVIRDIIGFGKGGYPVGGTTIIGTTTKEANPKGCIDPERLVRESVNATASYLNPMGIPMLHAIYKKHPGYAKPFALGHTIGIIPKKYALKDDPRPGDIALLIGGRTGRDGIHGATASSGEASSESHEKDFATVQIGDPITERKFMEAIPHIRDEGCIRSLTDLGAMGIGGAAGELGAKTGIRLNLNKVALKDTSLTAWEILVSESQERMLLAIPPEKLRQAKRILRIYGVEYAAIGKFTDTKKFEAFWHSPALNDAEHRKKVIDIDMSFLWGACPIEELPVKKPEDVGFPIPHIKWGYVDPYNLKKLVLAILGSYNVSSKQEALIRFDKTVQGRTVVEPLGGKNGRTPTHISVLAPKRGKRGIITTVSFNPQWAHLDPKTYITMNFLEAVSRAVLAGADPQDIFICSNFYTPKPTPEINWHLKKMVETLAKLTEEFKMPVITGKDSSSGTYITEEDERIDVPPTFIPSALGIVPDVRNVVMQDFKKTDSKVVLVGHISPIGPMSPIKNFFQKLQSLYRQKGGPILSASVVGEGGLLTNLFEMCYGGDMGIAINLNSLGNRKIEKVLFEDFIGSFVFEVTPDANPEELFDPLSWQIIGETQEDPKLFMYYDKKKHWMRWDISELAECYEKTFQEMIK